MREEKKVKRLDGISNKDEERAKGWNETWGQFYEVHLFLWHCKMCKM
jgi:hypothetical protein